MKPKMVVTLLIGAVAMGYGVYQMKYKVQTLKERAATLEAEIGREKAAIEVLRAEWAYLTRPARLERLADEHLDLAPMAPEQVVPLAELDRVLPRGDAVADKDGGERTSPRARRDESGARFAATRRSTP